MFVTTILYYHNYVAII